MLKRKILSDLINWKNTKNQECLLVKGARQVGKTYIIEEFGKTYYDNYVYLNFFRNPNLKNIFKGSPEASDISPRNVKSAIKFTLNWMYCLTKL